MEDKNINNNGVSFIVVASIVTAMLCWYTTRVSDNGVGASEVRGNIESVREKQQSAIDRLGNLESGLDSSIKSVGTISDGLANTAKKVDDTQNRIEAS